MFRPTRVFLAEDALSHNIQWLRHRLGSAKMVGMVKANAYGHGLWDITRRIAGKVDMLGVASIDEALFLRGKGLTVPILLSEGMFSPQEWPEILHHDLDTVVHTSEQIEWMTWHQDKVRKVRVWIKIDTGMGRLGFLPNDQIPDLLVRLKRHPHIREDVGIMSHFACSHNPNDDHNMYQIHQFRSIDTMLSTHKGPRSLCNSGGMIHFHSCHYDYVRAGIALYGIHPSSHQTGTDLGLRPVMRFVSSLIAVNTLPKGHSVGYGHGYICNTDMPVGIVAVGYGDGYPYRAMGGYVMIRGIPCPVIGAVSMDMIAVDLRSCIKACVGDDVVLWGDKGLYVEQLADAIHSSAYVLITGIKKRVEYIWV